MLCLRKECCLITFVISFVIFGVRLFDRDTLSTEFPFFFQFPQVDVDLLSFALETDLERHTLREYNYFL